ncbi:dNTP triphosphohydrolase, partial [Candidatus Sumerlaeota bacterium]|nr:dNTP triphosphohydrolase [Candidatus Sumerlaeota bacterium]
MGNIKPLYKKGDFLREKKLTEDYIRSPFRRDFARLIHSAAFRRLQGKTQLFPLSESDFFRNRLTHSLEVAQISKSIAILINKKLIQKELDKIPIQERDKYLIDYDLVEFAALAHDLGHPPFGHQGEFALDECMKEFGGFESNAQNLRILCRLEKKEKNTDYPSGIESGEDKRLGLNLTYRSLASILKYDKQIPYKGNKRKKPKKGYYNSDSYLVKRIKKGISGNDTIQNFKTIECQIMEIADDIAYSTYDLEDAFKTKFLSPMEILAEEDIILDKVARSVCENIEDRPFNKESVIEILHNI